MSKVAVRRLCINSKMMHVETQQVAWLLEQLGGEIHERRTVMEALMDTNTVIFGAYLTGARSAPMGLPLVGTLTLVKAVTPAGPYYTIHDVAVHESARRMGIAETMVLHALAHAQTREATHVDLTSQPHRESANALYQKLGFAQRHTNSYRLELVR